MSQQQLADLSALSVRAVRDIESGVVHQPRRQTVALLADALGLTSIPRRVFETAAGLGDAPDSELGIYLPRALNAMIGREGETDALVTALATGRDRITVISGMSGVGKTRVAMEVARRLAEQRKWQVVWVSCDQDADPDCDGLHERLTEAVRGMCRHGRSATSGLVRMISSDDVLLVLDGLADVGAIRSRLLDLLYARPRLRLLVTSLVPSRIAGTHTYPLRPLAVAAADCGLPEVTDLPAVRLLVERIGQVRPGFQPGTACTADLLRICQAVDGLPLAVETAAEQCAVFDPDEVLTSADIGFGPRVDEAMRRTISTLEPAHRGYAAALAAESVEWSRSIAAKRLAVDESAVAEFMYQLSVHGLVALARRSGGTRFRLFNVMRRYLVHEA